MKFYNFIWGEGESGSLVLLENDYRAEQIRKGLESVVKESVSCDQLDNPVSPLSKDDIKRAAAVIKKFFDP